MIQGKYKKTKESNKDTKKERRNEEGAVDLGTRERSEIEFHVAERN
jgi:hypothetical protein